MKIVFNLHQTGLGNNGGSRTILKCGSIMSSFGAEVIMFSNIPSGFTWEEFPNLKYVYGDRAPLCDVVIATGVKSVPNTLISRASKKFYYIRGFELWQDTEKNLFRSYRKLNCIVNSSWLKSKLESNGVKCHLVYNGIDSDKFYKVNDKRCIDIGATFSQSHKTKRHQDALEVASSMGISLQMLNKNIANSNDKKLNTWYNNIKIWFAPTELEGMHNPPMEASLAGCALVCTDCESGGMGDYAIHEKTALVYPARNLKVASEYIRRLLDDNNLCSTLNGNMIDFLKNKIQSREYNVKKMFEILKS